MVARKNSQVRSPDHHEVNLGDELKASALSNGRRRFIQIWGFPPVRKGIDSEKRERSHPKENVLERGVR